MPYCPNCGTQSQGSFCANCGTAIGPAPGASSQATGAPPPPPAPAAQSSGLETNVASALCYLAGLLTGILFLVLEPYNKNKTVRFHAFQSIFLNLSYFVVFIAIMIFSFIPYVGWIFGLVTGLLMPLVVLVVWLLLMYKAYNNERFVLPIIGPLAEKQA